MTAPDANRIIDAVAKVYGIERAVLLARGRQQPAAQARQVLYLLLRWFLSPDGYRREFALIGKMLGLDHSTVLYGARAAMARAMVSPDMTRKVRRACNLALKGCAGVPDLPPDPEPEPARTPEEKPAPVLVRSTARLPRNRFDSDDLHPLDWKIASDRNVAQGSSRLLAAIDAARAAA